MRSLTQLAMSLALLAPAVPVHAQERSWAVEILIGDAYNFDSRTTIDHATWGERSIDGDFETRGLEGPLHYAWRIARWQDDRAWELQLLHHKLYLRNRPLGIESLSISHGFNIVTVNRAFDLDGWLLRLGLGPVIAHAEASIRETSYDGPYELSGAAVLVGVGRTLDLTDHWYLRAEVSATLGYADVSPDGEPQLVLSVTNPALHAQVGVGYRF